MKIIIMGAPGAGKGTQSAQIVEKYGLEQISTGDMFREAVRSGSELGKKASECMRRGELVPDEVTIGIVRERLVGMDGYILDGFPRSVKQAESLVEMGEEPDYVININVSRGYLLERAVGRRICKKCGATYHVKYNAPSVEGVCDKCGGELYQRADDNEETLRKRLETYENQTKPLIEYYKNRGKYNEVDGSCEIEKVTSDIFRILEGAN